MAESDIEVDKVIEKLTAFISDPEVQEKVRDDLRKDKGWLKFICMTEKLCTETNGGKKIGKS